MAQLNLYQQYKTQALETLTKGEIVVKLFEEASKQISTAIFFIKQQDFVKAYNCIAKAQKVVSTLDNSLDRQYPISIELNQLYMFIFDKLTEANLKKDIELMKSMLGLIDELKNTFKQAEILARAGK